MRFSAAVVLLATGAMATNEINEISTAYTTELVTITSCGPEVPDCPAESTVVTTTNIPVTDTTSVCPEPTEEPPSSPPAQTNGTLPGTGAPTASVPAPTQLPPTEVPTEPVPAPTAAPPSECVPSQSTTAITKSYTTVLTSVEYSTIEVPCETATEQPSASYTAPVTTAPPAGGNTTVPEPTAPITAGAAGIAGSAAFAGFAGLAAFVLA